MWTLTTVALIKIYNRTPPPPTHTHIHPYPFPISPENFGRLYNVRGTNADIPCGQECVSQRVCDPRLRQVLGLNGQVINCTVVYLFTAKLGTVR